MGCGMSLMKAFVAASLLVHVCRDVALRWIKACSNEKVPNDGRMMIG